MKFIVTKGGSVTTPTGYVYIAQNRNIAIIGKLPKKEDIAGSFEMEVPEEFDPLSPKYYDLVTKILNIAKKIAGITQKKKPVKKTRK